LTPFAGASGWTPAQETVREQVNSFIHTSNECDGVIDQDAAIRDPNNPTFMLAALNQNPAPRQAPARSSSAFAPAA